MSEKMAQSKELGIDKETKPPESPKSSLADGSNEEKGRPPSDLSDSDLDAPIVPRHLRRGFLARFALIPETTHPTRYPRRTKWLLTFVVAMAAAAAPVGSASIMPALSDVGKEFHASDKTTDLCVALYMLSMSIFPLWWSSFSERFGRRSVYIVSFALFVVFAAVSAEARSISELIVARVLSGGAAASVQAVGAGTIADVWEPRERGRAMGIFYLGPLCGPLFAPIIGGALTQRFGWRATQWFLVAFGCVVEVGLLLLLPETLRRRTPLVLPEEGAAAGKGVGLQKTTTRQSVKDGARRGALFLKQAMIDPLKIILLLRYPAVAITVYYAAITFGTLYFLNVSIELTFSRAPYGYKSIIVGLLYIPNSVGYFLASIFGGRWLDKIMKREAKKKGRVDKNGKLILLPEDRMQENAWLAAILFPAALIWYGWGVEKGLPWIVPVWISLEWI
jgi:multidrug resistance protein